MGLLARNLSYEPLHRPAVCDADRDEVYKRNAQLSSYQKTRRIPLSYAGPLSTFRAVPKDSPGCLSASTTPALAEDMLSAEDEDIHRAPESSSDEEAPSSPKNQTEESSFGSHTLGKTAIISESNQCISPSRKRSKRRRIDVEQTKSVPALVSSTLRPGGTEEDWLSGSQLSQGKKSKRNGVTYSSSQSKTESFKVPTASPETPRRSRKQDHLLSFGVTPEKEKRITPSKFDRQTWSPSLGTHSTQIQSLQILASPPRTDIPGSSFSTGGLDFGETLTSPYEARLNRQSSSSSLSSADSIAEYLLEEEQQNRLMGDSHANGVDHRTQVRCPMCKLVTDRTGLGVYEEPAKFTLRKQQRFCYQHRLRDAEKMWRDEKYPKIDWDEILKSRVPAHLESLLKVLRRQVPSHYLQILDSNLQEANGNQSTYRKYFDSAMMDEVRHGYYGPKGAKILASAIAQLDEIPKTISIQSRSDKTLKATSLVRLIDAVLLPELMCMLVMEDMLVSDPIEARTILKDSTEIGVLLQSDDDYVRIQNRRLP